jgi:uncharacterized protein YcsI (UPF0317 family)
MSSSLVFHGHTVVSMRPYRPEELERVRKITSRYIYAHGEPIAWVRQLLAVYTEHVS